MSTPLEDIALIDESIDRSQYEELLKVFPQEHFEALWDDGFPFYGNTFWYGRDQEATNVFEQVIDQLAVHACPSAEVVGVEWWFSVMDTNVTPQWLLSPHFDRSDLQEKDFEKITHPEKASVLFLNSVPYGELVVTDQVLTGKGKRPRQPKEMQFIEPVPSRYAVFPGHLYHGVIGRMWRAKEQTALRVSMAVNYWTEKPTADYLRDSSTCFEAFSLTEA